MDGHVCSNYIELLRHNLQNVFSEYGFHHFQKYNYFCTLSFNSEYLLTLPHDIHLYVWYNSYSNFNDDNQTIKISSCLGNTNKEPLDCLPKEDVKDILALKDGLENFELRKKSCISNVEVVAITLSALGLIVSLILVILFLSDEIVSSCLGWHIFNRPSNQKKGQYSRVDNKHSKKSKKSKKSREEVTREDV